MFAAFKRFFKDSKLTAVLRPDGAQLLQGLPALDEIIAYDKKKKHRGISGIRKLATELREREFDVLLSPHDSHRTSFVAMFSKIPERYGFKDAGFARLAYNRRLERHGGLPEIKRLLHFLDDSIAPGAAEFSTQLSLVEDKASIQEAEALLRKHEALRPILLAPSSVWPTKRWTPYGFAELAAKLVRRYKTKILLVGAPGDREICDSVQSFLKELQPHFVQEKVETVAGDTSLRGFYSLVKRSRLLISNDSAPVHYACAAGIPLVAVFGPTTQSLGYAPITKNSRIAELDLACRPCGTHGGLVCPLGHFRCMKELTADSIMEQVQALIDQ